MARKILKIPNILFFFKKQIVGRTIVAVSRRAKNVLIELNGKSYILIHMKMTGQLLFGKYKKSESSEFKWVAAEDGPLKNSFSRFIHLVFTLDDGNHIAFSDMRKFGTTKFLCDLEALQNEFHSTGPEPLESDFTFSVFSGRINLKKNKSIKTVLIDPTVISGIGNIYSDEILFESFILPNRKVLTLSEVEQKLIFKNIKKILKKGIILGGDSMSDYRNPYGEKGQFQLCHKVYGRKNQNCKNKDCDSKICRVMIDGRSAHFCPGCQG